MAKKRKATAAATGETDESKRACTNGTEGVQVSSPRPETDKADLFQKCLQLGWEVFFESVEVPSHTLPKQTLFRSTVTLQKGGVEGYLRSFSTEEAYNRKKAAENAASRVALQGSPVLEQWEARQAAKHVPTDQLDGNLMLSRLHLFADKVLKDKPVFVVEDLADTVFRATVNVGGHEFVGDAAKSKKLARQGVARKALMALEGNASGQVAASSLPAEQDPHPPFDSAGEQAPTTAPSTTVETSPLANPATTAISETPLSNPSAALSVVPSSAPSGVSLGSPLPTSETAIAPVAATAPASETAPLAGLSSGPATDEAPCVSIAPAAAMTAATPSATASFAAEAPTTAPLTSSMTAPSAATSAAAPSAALSRDPATAAPSTSPESATLLNSALETGGNSLAPPPVGATAPLKECTEITSLLDPKTQHN
eukprot:TRINITY_DN2168_c0_g1_i1.p1 TRINITY_DN2168_c0_g1~~TRINITY_DN2168_c0_g1_i1.p1  ORF type:complete len:427 (+),score=84.94 TRINITY_DN2168_c0_g1_i1:187-1467(+)